MRARALILLFVPACSVLISAQTAPQPPAPTPATPSATVSAAPALPVRRVVLYKTGVGYFEHLGNVRNRQDVTIRFTSAQLNDVLKSLTAIDLGKGQISGISYNSVAPLEQRLGGLRLPLDQGTTALQLLGSLRGARVEVSGATGVAEGRLLSVEQRAQTRGTETTTIDGFSIVTDAGELRSFDLTPAIRIRVVERDLRQEIGRYLDLVGSAREQDVRSLTLSTTGTGERPLFVSYISEVPIWKTTYRLVLPAKGRPLLQGWAIVDNTIGEDWQGVELSLVAGAPQSFIQQVSQPYYGHRAVVPMPSNVLLTPQTHQATLQSGGAGTVTGRVTDPSGSVLPGVRVALMSGSSEIASTITGANGEYSLAGPPGQYRVEFRLTGFTPRSVDTNLGAEAARQNVTLSVGALSETVNVAAASPPPPPPPAAFRTGVGRGGGGGGIVGGVVGGLPEAPLEQLRDVQAAATAGDLGDLFEYRIKEPVTLKKNQSALVPIVNQEITADKVSLWNRTSGSGRPLRALWLTNATGLTLDGGSMTVLDGDAFAGEGLIEPLKPAERRLMSYGADLGVLVDARMDGAPRRILRVRAREGILTQETEERTSTTYKARNEGTTASTLVIEHRVRAGWKLADGQTPIESTPDTQRFRVVVEPKKEAELVVREIRSGESRVTLGNINTLTIAQLAQSGVPAAALEQALKPLIDKQAEVAALDRRLQELQGQRASIVEDQQRLRENMKALRGSAEEKQLLQRYTRQLDEQETRLDTLQKDIAGATTARDAARAQLGALIGSLSFELAGER
jgi:hypothetical protein